MFRRFENMVDPYVDYPPTDRPPTRLLPFLLDYAQPFRAVFIWAALLAVLVAGVEIGLIWAMGWVVDILSGDPAQVSAGLSRLIERYRPDELILSSAMHDPKARQRSYAIAMDALQGLDARAA